MYCKNCGIKLDEGSMFCPSCGYAVADESAGRGVQASSQTLQTAVQAAGSTVVAAKKAKIIGGAVIVGVIAAVLIIYNVFFVERPINTVKKFVNALNNKDANTAVACMDPKYEKLYSAASNILSKFTGGINIKDVADLFPAICDLSKEEGNKADAQLDIEDVASAQINGDSAIIVVNLKSKETDDNGVVSEKPVRATFYLTKFSEGWRIIDIK